jgi:hypothetical protein
MTFPQVTPQAAVLEQPLPGGQSWDRQGCAYRDLDVARQTARGCVPRSPHIPPVCRPGASRRARHPLSDRESRRAAAEGADHASQFMAGNEGVRSASSPPPGPSPQLPPSGASCSQSLPARPARPSLELDGFSTLLRTRVPISAERLGARWKDLRCPPAVCTRLPGGATSRDQRVTMRQNRTDRPEMTR